MSVSGVDDPLVRLIAELSDAGVEFIVVGGAAAVLQNAPIVTEDVDIVHRRTEENITRLTGVLERLDAYFRGDPARRKLRPRASDFAGHGHILLQTELGKLDVLCEISGQRGYEELVDHTVQVGDGALVFRVLDLPMLIRVKAEANRPKDRLVLPILLATLEERKKRVQGT